MTEEKLFLGHFAALITFVFTLVLVGNANLNKRSAGSTFAWLLLILLSPYIGIPLFWLFGGRKFNRVSGKKIIHNGQYLRLYPNFPWTESQLIKTTTDSKESFEDFLFHINNTKTEILISTYCIERDKYSKIILEALISKAKEGIKVKLLIDSMGGILSYWRMIKKLEVAGGEVYSFLPFFTGLFRGESNLRNHRKIALFDRNIAIVGGRNIGHSYFAQSDQGNLWHDISYTLAGDVIQHLLEVFALDWHYTSGQSIDLDQPQIARGFGNHLIRLTPSGPDVDDDVLYDQILEKIYQTKNQIIIATPYFVPDSSVLRALNSALRRNVEIKIYIPEKSNHLLPDIARSSALRDLRTNGAQIYYLDRMIHAKASIFDQHFVISGTANFDMRSLFYNFEFSLLFNDPQLSVNLIGWLNHISLNAKRSSTRKQLPQFIENIVNLLAPLL